MVGALAAGLLALGMIACSSGTDSTERQVTGVTTGPPATPVGATARSATPAGAAARQASPGGAAQQPATAASAAAERRAAIARSAATDRRTRCAKPTIASNPPRIIAPPFPFRDRDRANPICRLAQRRTIDVPLSSGISGRRFAPRPRCGNYSRRKRCFPSAYRQGNARVRRGRLALPFAPADPLIPLYDSFGPEGSSPRSAAPFAFLEQGPYDGCFNVYDRKRRLRGSTDPRTATGVCAAANAGRELAAIEFQGRGCMATRGLERRFVIAGVIQAPGAEVALNTGLRGFVPLYAVPVAPGVDRERVLAPQDTPGVRGGLNSAELRRLHDAYPGCGRKARSGMRALASSQRAPADTELHVADNAVLSAATRADGSFGWPNPSFPSPDQYLNATTLGLGCREQSATTPVAGCSGFYGNYQGPCYAPEIAGVALSSTAVSGSNTTRADNPGNVRTGGVVRAFVRRDAGPGTFQPVDRMLIADNNVPDAQGAVVTWVFGNFNPLAGLTNKATGATGSNREQSIWGWTAIRRPRAPTGHFTC